MATTVWEVIEAARQAGGKPLAAETAPARPGELSQSMACVDRAAELLGWRPGRADIPAALAYEHQVRQRL